MLKKIITTGIFSLLTFCCLAQQRHSLSQDNDFVVKHIYTKNDTITYIHSKTDLNSRKPLLIFLQGSLAKPLFCCEGNYCQSILPFNYKKYLDRYNFAIIARKGIPIEGSFTDAEGFKDKQGKPPIEFMENDNLEYRVFQLQNVTNNLKKEKWVDHSKIYIVGHSEGYEVLAKFGEKDKIANKYVFMSGSPFNRTTEYILQERLKQYSSKNISDNIEENINKHLKFRDYYLELENQQKSLVAKNWYSYNKEFAYKSLNKIKTKSLIINGTLDNNSIHNDMLPLLVDTKIFDIKNLPGLDHNFFSKGKDELNNEIDIFGWDTVFEMVINWIENN